ncbi:hypothetical protein DSO57_1003272 [Entomophthora muscae]|uniref:Uncharacterized protein n=1 Tax=Entomophthora muscae TaxID=34485 RepID=A0ACC2SLH8_9FUNG|nr:hypothetical protein DSO57_1003272 [Entomophthora muscae]
MTREVLAQLTHSKWASNWAVPSYKDAQLVRLELVSLTLKKTKILLADFGLAWSANKKGVPMAMNFTFAKTEHEKISSVFNKLCEFTEAFAGKRLHLVVYLSFLFYFGMGTNFKDLDRVFLGIDKVRLSLNGKEIPLRYDSVDHVIQDTLVLAGIYRVAAPPEKLLLNSVMVVSIMPDITCYNCKAWKSGKPLSKLTKLRDLKQTVDQKWVAAAPVCHLDLITPCKLTLIKRRNLIVT